MNGKEIIKKLDAEGWRLHWVNGSHHIMHKDGVSVSVPVHGSKDTGVKLK